MLGRKKKLLGIKLLTFFFFENLLTLHFFFEKKNPHPRDREIREKNPHGEFLRDREMREKIPMGNF